MASNNKEFQEYLETFDDPSKHRGLLWDAWVEATRVAEKKLTDTQQLKAKFFALIRECSGSVPISERDTEILISEIEQKLSAV